MNVNASDIAGKIKSMLTAKEFTLFAESMKSAEWRKDDSGNDIYTPYLSEILLVYNTIKFYYIDFQDLEGNADEIYNLVIENGLYEQVYYIISETLQYKRLLNVVYNAQEVYRNERIGINGLIRTVKDLITNFDVKKSNEELKNILAGLSDKDFGILENILKTNELFDKKPDSEKDKNQFSELIGKVFDVLSANKNINENIVKDNDNG